MRDIRLYAIYIEQLREVLDRPDEETRRPFASFTLSSRIKEGIELAAQALGVSRSEIARIALESYLNALAETGEHPAQE